MTDFADARRMMVDRQIRPSDVTDPDLITAMLEVRRERFVPAAQASLAYLDRDIAIDGSRALLKPMVLARMIQAADVAAGDRVLDVAGGTGYSAAILARLAGSVVALEDEPSRAKRCGELAKEIGIAPVTAATGPLNAGWPALAPYDAILINGACEAEPRELLSQLNEGGRLIAIMGTGPGGKAVLYRKDRGEIGSRALFDAAGPALPAFAKAPVFVF
jgi:protein-L-isoaspartate(D-aspartate) O-methyltransferase